MKKTYMKPEMAVYKIATVRMISASDTLDKSESADGWSFDRAE